MDIYTKICLHCVYGESFDNAMAFLHRNNIVEEIKRTTYLPDLHEQATEIYGADNYVAFVVYNGQVMDWEEMSKKIADGKEFGEIFSQEKPKKDKRKAKPVQAGKAK